MTHALEIRPLTLEEMAIPIDWARQEGWNPGLQDAPPFWNTDPEGFLGGFLGDKLVAVISGVRYEGTEDPAMRGGFGFVGFYIVHPDYRGQPYAGRIGKAAVAHLSGMASIGIDGVLERQENYQAFGFEFAHKNARYQGQTPLPDHATSLAKDECIQPAHLVDFEALCRFDAAHFPTTRKSFLKRWVEQSDHTALALTKGEQNAIIGYGVIRPCFEGYKIGPLFAKESAYAEALIGALCNGLPAGTHVYLDPPASNADAIKLAKKLNMTLVFETARMYRGISPKLPINEIYGITSFELG